MNTEKRIIITIDSFVTGELAEQLEDALADVVRGFGLHGKIDSEITHNNITVDPTDVETSIHSGV